RDLVRSGKALQETSPVSPVRQNSCSTFAAVSLGPACLSALKDQEFEKHPVIVHGPTPHRERR
ncbi:MAG: hypothetical protein ACREXY_14315, partial [Gammaproteobacteria bacterium]